MHKIVILSLALTITIIFFFIIYLIPYFSKKKIRKGKFDLFQFLILFFAPMFAIPILYFFRQIIVSNPEKFIIKLPKYFSELGFLVLIYFLVLGMGIHSVAVVLSKHMKDLRKHRVWEITEFFHHQFSHLLATASAVLIVFSFCILEINRPNLVPMLNYEIMIIIICGIIVGIFLALACIEGSIPNSMFFILYVLSLVILFIFIRYNLNYRYFPFTTFVETIYITSVITLLFIRQKKRGFPELVPHHFFD